MATIPQTATMAQQQTNSGVPPARSEEHGSRVGLGRVAGVRYIHNVSIEGNNDPVQVYLREVGMIPPLAADEETELSQHVLAHDEQADFAGRRLIEANLAMVVAIAERHHSADVQVLDLIQKGNDGLLLALNTFAGPSGSFSAHAANCIEHAISKATAESQRHRE